MGSRHTRRSRGDEDNTDRERETNRNEGVGERPISTVPESSGGREHRQRRAGMQVAALAASVTDDDGDDGDDSDIVTVLTQLLRSGQVRIVRASFGAGSGIHIIRGTSFLESEDGGDLASLFHGTMSRPQEDSCPDTSGLNDTDFRQQVLMDSGEVLNMCNSNITSRLLKRETAVQGRQHFAHGDRAFFSSKYLPSPGSMKVKATYNHKAFCGKYSTDGTTFASACQDQCIRLYDTRNGQFKEFSKIQAQNVGWSILDIAYSPDQQYLIYSSWSDYIHLCNIYGDTSTHHALHLAPQDRKFCAFSVVFSQDNREILAGANSGSLYVYDRGSNQRILRIGGHEDDVNSVVFADDSSQTFFSGADDGLCKVWDRRILREECPIPVGVLAGHSDGITCVDAKSDGFHLISNSKDQTIKLWDIRKFSGDEAVKATKTAVAYQRWDYRWQPVPQRVHRTAKAPGDTSLMTYRGHGVLHTLIRSYFSPALTTGQRFIYSGCSTGSVVIYDVLTGRVVRRLHGHKSCVRDVSWHPYESKIVSTSWDGTLGLWEFSREDMKTRTERHGAKN